MRCGRIKLIFLAIIFITFSLLPFCISYQSPPVQAAVPFTKYSGELTLENELYVTNVWVVKDGSSYEMWYTHARTDLSLSDIADGLDNILTADIINDIASLDIDSLLNHLSGVNLDALYDFLSATATVIGYATSSDGITWTVDTSEAFSGLSGGVWDSVAAPCIIKNSPTDYEMWYTHSKTTLTKTELGDILTGLGGTQQDRKDAIISLLQSMSSVIGYATSGDGRSWTVVNDQVLDSASSGVWDSVATPSVIKNASDDYEMWYTRGETDLTEQNLEDILSDINNFGIDELWSLFDGSRSVIGYATSNNGWEWTVVEPEVLSGDSSSILDSVGAPSVVKIGSSYEMWYSHIETDITKADIQAILDEVPGLDLPGLFAILQSGDLGAFLDEFVLLLGDPDAIPPIEVNPSMAAIKAILDNSTALIGYATSGDGQNWTVANPSALTGTSTTPWSSVAFPCVVYDNGAYEIWFTQGVDELLAQSLLDILQGDTLPIGYATYSGSVSIELVAGWNLIGLPVIPASTAIEDILSAIIGNVTTVWRYDASTGIWDYFTTIEGAPAGDLTELTEGYGYWVEMANPATLIINP